MSVDLPAPFSPSNATISPAFTSIPASLSACVPPNCFDTPRITSNSLVLPGNAEGDWAGSTANIALQLGFMRRAWRRSVALQHTSLRQCSKINACFVAYPTLHLANNQNHGRVLTCQCDSSP